MHLIVAACTYLGPSCLAALKLLLMHPQIRLKLNVLAIQVQFVFELLRFSIDEPASQSGHCIMVYWIVALVCINLSVEMVLYVLLDLAAVLTCKMKVLSDRLWNR